MRFREKGRELIAVSCITVNTFSQANRQLSQFYVD